MQVFFTLVIRKLRLDVLISIFFLFFHILKKVYCTMSSQVSHLSIYLWAKTHKGEKNWKKRVRNAISSSFIAILQNKLSMELISFSFSFILSIAMGGI